MRILACCLLLVVPSVVSTTNSCTGYDSSTWSTSEETAASACGTNRKVRLDTLLVFSVSLRPPGEIRMEDPR